MNTLGKSITSSFFRSPDDYARLRQFWSQKMRAREKLPASYHGLYMILIGRNWLRGFTLPKTIKDPYSTGPVRVIRQLRWSHIGAEEGRGPVGFFLEFLSDGAFDRVLQYLPETSEVERCVKEGAEIQPYKMPATLAGMQNG